MNEINKGKLDGAWAYLSGAMEFVADNGVGWRRKFISLAVEAGLDIVSIDPTNKPGDGPQAGEDKEHQIRLQKEGRWAELQKYVGGYRRLDLRYVDLSDFLVAFIDPSVPQWGTADEIYFAESQHKPMFFIIEGGLARLPRWLFDVIDIEDEKTGRRCNVFETVEDVIDELVFYDNGLTPMSDDWVLIRKHIEKERQARNRQKPL